MHVQLGFCAVASKDNKPQLPVAFDSGNVVNPHWLILGTSGSGKSQTLRKVLREAQTGKGAAPPRGHVMDVHKDMNVPGASTVIFSESTQYGINPLRVDPDPHYGGVRKRVQTLIETMNRTMRQLGPKQEACLRNILYDLYALHGFKVDDPTTWIIRDEDAQLFSNGDPGRLYLEIPIWEKDHAKSLAPIAFDGETRSWWIAPDKYVGAITRWPRKTVGRTHPSIEDALRLGKRILEMQFLGTDQESLANLETFAKASAMYRRKVDEYRRKKINMTDDEKDIFEKDLDKRKEKTMTSMVAYMDKIRSGREVEEILRYDSVDVLQSVIERLESLFAKGVCKREVPPFDPNSLVWRYDLSALGRDEKRLFVHLKLREIFDKNVRLGETQHIRDVFVLDEASMFADDDPENIVNIVVKEGRKFGLMLAAASQNPPHFSDDFLSLVGTKVILGLDEMYWSWCTTKMKVPVELLKWIRLRRSLLVQFKTIDNAQVAWRPVLVPQEIV